MTETYDPDLLVSFLAVAETGSFSEAARRRGLRQSTVSQQVRRLEAETRRRAASEKEPVSATARKVMSRSGS